MRYVRGQDGTRGGAPQAMRLRLLSVFMRPAAPSLAKGIVVATSFIVVETLAVILLKQVSPESGFSVLFLLGVLVVSAVWGLGLAVATSLASALAFDYFRTWPAGEFMPFQPQTLLVPAVFLIVALMANALGALARVGERFFALSPDLLCITRPDRVMRVNPAFTRILGYSLDDLASRPYVDIVVPEDRDRVRAVLEDLDDREPARFENRVVCRDGTQRWIEWSLVRYRGAVYAVGRDVTERRCEQDELRDAQALVQASRDKLALLADQQAALRRVATLVARGVSPAEIFSVVAEEMANCLHVNNASVSRFDSDEVVILALSRIDEGMENKPKVGQRHTLEGDNIATRVRYGAHPARLDSVQLRHAPGSIAARIRDMGLSSTVAVPIVVDARVWGMAAVGSTGPDPMPPDTEERMCDFAELVATAIANAATRAELVASRARIVAAGDQARRRLDRDLHDGIQQQLVSLALELRIAESLTPPEPSELKEQLSHVMSGLTGVSADLQELSRGIHPAILSKGGLGSAIRTAARRSAVPVALDIAIDGRLPETVEIAAYYVVSEALTNVAKHAQASQVKVSARAEESSLQIVIRDDGVGGADARKGSGLSGLADRVEAVGGRLQITSHVGGGTSVRVEIPTKTA
jgi:PAS domain S-box-containing protein